MSEEALPEIDFQQSISTMFGTPFVSVDWPDVEEMNQQIFDLVMAEEQADDLGRGIRSNAGGWQSRGNLLMRPEPCIARLKQMMETTIFELLGALVRKDGRERTFTLLFDSWANVCRNGNYNVVHSHPNAMYSIVYYVSIRVSPTNPSRIRGMLELLDPREATNLHPGAEYHPRRTDVCQIGPDVWWSFPSWVKHMVHPFVGNGVRISIACNVNVVEEVRTSRPQDFEVARSSRN